MRVRVAHTSMQFSDSNEHHTSDVAKIFERAVNRKVAWVTGTEAGPGADNLGKELVRIAKGHGYRPWVPTEQAKNKGRATDCWVAVREDLITNGWKQGFDLVIPSSYELYKNHGLDPHGSPNWGPRGLTHVSFNSKVFGSRVAIGSAHYLTGAPSPKVPAVKGVNHWDQNEKLAHAIGAWFRDQGKGKNIAFYTGDQNMNDTKTDTFMGVDVTSIQDELKKWANTGHGPIDVIASYNKDRRVKAQQVQTFTDREFRLHGDHFYIEATYTVEPLKN